LTFGGGEKGKSIIQETVMKRTSKGKSTFLNPDRGRRKGGGEGPLCRAPVGGGRIRPWPPHVGKGRVVGDQLHHVLFMCPRGEEGGKKGPFSGTAKREALPLSFLSRRGKKKDEEASVVHAARRGYWEEKEKRPIHQPFFKKERGASVFSLVLERGSTYLVQVDYLGERGEGRT